MVTPQLRTRKSQSIPDTAHEDPSLLLLPLPANWHPFLIFSLKWSPEGFSQPPPTWHKGRRGKTPGAAGAGPKNAHLCSCPSSSHGSFSSTWESHALFGPFVGSVGECIYHVINMLIICHPIRSQKFLENFQWTSLLAFIFLTQPDTKPLVSVLRNYLYKL